MATLKENVGKLNDHLTELERVRYSNPLANDIYEAAWYWRDLGQWVVEKNTKTDYPTRAKEEQLLLDRLKRMASAQSPDEIRRYQPLFETAGEVLEVVGATLPPKDGHMGILRIIRANFSFLETHYGFAAVDQRPMGMMYTSDAVWIELTYAERTNQCCTFGPEKQGRDVFWPEDLLFMNADQRYHEAQQEHLLENANELEAWFQFLAEIMWTYGRDVLTNQPGIFGRLADARARRDAEITAAMNAQYGDRQ